MNTDQILALCEGASAQERSAENTGENLSELRQATRPLASDRTDENSCVATTSNKRARIDDAPSTNDIGLEREANAMGPAPPKMTYEFKTKLAVRRPTQMREGEAVSAAVLVWSSERQEYVPDARHFEITLAEWDKVSDKERKQVVGVLEEWRRISEDSKLEDSKHIITNIIDLLEDDEEWKENACEVMLVRHDGVLQGISCYEHRGILECAEEIPPWEKDWIYAMFTAANPQSQLPRKDRPNNTIGGVGAACHVAYAKLSNDLNVPIYRHQTTQRSLDLAIRQGNTLVYA